MATAPRDTPFSVLLRTATAEQHAEAESTPFTENLLSGRLGRAAYVRYTEQLWFLYRALEAPLSAGADSGSGPGEGGVRLVDDPVAGPFLQPALLRGAALQRDLDHLHGGADWRSTLRPLPSTAAYADRIAEVARDWPAGYVAHHYTRYLGDLSGGQVIRGTAERTWGFDRRGDGVRFYVFEDIDNPAAFKRDYRERLDALPLHDLEKQRVLEECRRAFTFNTAVFRELGAQFPLSA